MSSDPETVLVCVSPEASSDLYRLLESQLAGKGWEPYVISASEVARARPVRVAAVIAYASDWPDDKLADWLAAIRASVGPRKRVLALLPRPPHQYPPEVQSLWNRALGYGFTFNEVVAVIDDFIAGRA